MFNHHTTRVGGALLVLALATTFIAGCASAPRSEMDQEYLRHQTQASLKAFKQADPTLEAKLNEAYGYAIIPEVAKGAAGVGGAHGWGEVYEQGDQIGYVEMVQGTIGLQLGGQTYSELILFKDQATFEGFKRDEVEFAAQASAVAAAEGAASAADYNRGVLVFTRTRGGLMFEASIGGQSFDFQTFSD